MEKILHYVTIMNRAGEETFIMNVFRTIDRNKVIFDFLVSSDKEGDYDSEIKRLGGSVYHISFSTMKRPFKRLGNFIKLYKCLKRYSKDHSVFHIHTQHAMDAILDSIAAKLAGFKKIIVHSHSTQTQFHRRAHYFCRPFLNIMPIYRFACSDKAGKWLYGEKGKFEIINNGILTKSFLFNSDIREKIRTVEGWKGRTVIGHVGSFTYPKNHSFLVEVFSSYLHYDSSALLVLVGKGKLMDEIREKVRKAGLLGNVVFMGGRDDVNKLYSAFDVLLFPSLYEGLPVTLVEAQAADLVCLISDSITTEIDISSNIHRMSLKESPDAWAKEVFSLRELVKRSNCERFIEDSGFDINQTSSKLLDVYTS